MQQDDDYQQQQESTTTTTTKVLEVKTIKTFAELLRFKKATNLAVICFCVPADPSCSTFLQALGSAGGLLTTENDSVAVGIIDVDATQEDVCGVFKIKAMPSTLFFRDARETARIEGCDLDQLRTTVTAHLISTVTSSSSNGGDVKKSSSKGESVAAPPSTTTIISPDIKIVNCYFGNLDSGKFVDVTDKVREICTSSSSSIIIAANKEFLGCEKTFENTENNKLRIVVDRNGVGKTFTINEGKQLNFGEALNFFFKEQPHAGRDLYDHREMLDANGDEDFSGFVNPYGGLPSLPKPQQKGCGCG